MKCFYHNDMDGKCSAAIVNYFHQKYSHLPKPLEIEYIPINYDDSFPFGKIEKHESIIIVDFSLQKPGEFDKLLSITRNVIWIDHHKTALEQFPDIDLEGIRDSNYSGCQLTWAYYFPTVDPPLVVSMLGSYDIWDFSYFPKENLDALQCGIRLEDTNPTAEIWTKCFTEDSITLGIIDKGKISLLYRDSVWKSMVDANAFWSNFEGYNCICLNAMQVSSDVFASVKEDYDLMMPFYFNGEQWTISLYTKKDIDCGQLAKKYGGGGHAHASGFSSGTLPFKFIKRLKDV